MIRALWVACVLPLAGALAMPIPARAETNPATENKDGAKREWGTAVEGQAVSIAVEKATYPPGEVIMLDVLFKNVGEHDVRAIEGASVDWFMYRLIVLLPAGKEAPLTLYGKKAHENWRDGSACLIILKSGEQRRNQFALSRLFDFSLPGKYTVFVERKVVVKAEKGFSISTATSNTLNVIVDDRRTKDE